MMEKIIRSKAYMSCGGKVLVVLSIMIDDQCIGEEWDTPTPLELAILTLTYPPTCGILGPDKGDRHEKVSYFPTTFPQRRSRVRVR
jgi:hypothetical protein